MQYQLANCNSLMLLSTLVTSIQALDSLCWNDSRQMALGQVCMKIIDCPLSSSFYHYSKFIHLSATEDRMGLQHGTVPQMQLHHKNKNVPENVNPLRCKWSSPVTQHIAAPCCNRHSLISPSPFSSWLYHSSGS